MSYAVSESLQAAVFTALSADAAVSVLIGAHIYDAVPSGALPTVYIALGEEKVRDHSTNTASGALHDIAVDIHSDTAGFQTAKALAGAVCDALIDADLVLSRGVLTSLNFRFARARKGISPDQRVINLTFRAFVMDV
ncbi:DUF3168 domain-containing protein [Amylibacter sp. SFDW26]|uniref:DUF3168 domain-containing protein n=1 Tax=Amylibacter sp. SFDW26 TaxID=2652722 RepID=UPI001262153A|nr:DUF3168 domain-containing protein [Amylibacter sp. SFDW26]KAB7616079.1 DUF3168 domain-containing protein [Amylibacter sp. SFDW26]